MKTMLKNEGKITTLVFPDDSTLSVGGLPGHVSEDYVVSITAYEEPGGLGPVVWFHAEWYLGGVTKYNSAHVSMVSYK